MIVPLATTISTLRSARRSSKGFFAVTIRSAAFRYDIGDRAILYEDAKPGLHLHVPGSIQYLSICKCVIHKQSSVLNSMSTIQ